MKRIVLGILTLMLVTPARTQLWEEWFQQDQTALKYSTEQVVALRTYGRALQKGYTIVQEGLNTIEAIKSGDFNLHKAFFDRLDQVNPRLRNSWNGADLASLQVKAVALYQQYRTLVKNSEALTPAEIDYGHRVCRKLQETHAATVKQLRQVLSDQILQLDDAERTRSVDALHAQAEEAYQFGRHLLESYRLLAGQRRQAVKENIVLGALYNK